MTPPLTNRSLTPRFDWYQCTGFRSAEGGAYDCSNPDEARYAAQEALEAVGLSPNELAARLAVAHGSATVSPGCSQNGYESCLQIRDKDQDELVATLMWGRNPGINVKTTGHDAITLTPAIRKWMPDHRVSRLDSAIDISEIGLFDRLSRLLMDEFEPTRVRVHQVGQWDAGYSRTLYIGSRKSTSQLVIYEKGYLNGKLVGDPNHVRIEARVYPDGAAGNDVASWDERLAFSGTRLLKRAADIMGLEAHAAQQIGTVRKMPDKVRTRRHLVTQYRRVLLDWLHEAGSWEALGLELEAALADVESEERRVTELANPHPFRG